jgi:hypothetical protein
MMIAPRSIIINKIVLVVIAILSLSIQPRCAECKDNANDLKRIERDYFKLISTKSFISAAELFHYPAHYSQQERLKDLKIVSRMLYIISEEFGKITEKSKLEIIADYHDVFISGGDIPYWRNHADLSNIKYRVRFSKEGEGYIIIFFCKIDKELEIAKVAYGLPAANPDSKIRILEIARKLSFVIKQETERDTAE